MTNMFYTREQIERLEKYRKNFETAVNSGFARNIGSIALREIEQIYDEALGSHYSYNNGCGVCVLQFIKKVGEPFLQESAIYAAQDRIKAEKTNMQVVEDMEVKEESLVITTEETNDPPKPKRTRKKKEIKEDGTEQS